MLLTLGAAGATVLVMLAVVAIPAVDACRGDSRGLVGCLRGIVDDRFDLRWRSQPTPAPVEVPLETPTVPEAPVVAATEPQSQLADAPVVQPGPEPIRSLTPPATDNPLTPTAASPPQVVAEPPVEASPAASSAVVETIDTAEPEVTPTPEAPAPTEAVAPEAPFVVPTPPAVAGETGAPSVVSPPPTLAVKGIPPDLQVAAALPDPASPSEPAPDLALPATPELPTTPPPDLVAAEDTVAEPPVAETSAAPELPGTEASVPPVAVQPIEQTAPVVVLLAPPELPELPTPPPDLAVAAIDPVAPDDPPQPPAPVLIPSIDAVEIDGDGTSIAGSGPAGATMRLYVDGLPAGMSPVEAGRWLVEGTGLLTEPRQTLKVEALDAITGKVIGEATAEFEQRAPPAAEAPATLEAPAAGPLAVPAIAPVVPVGEGPSVTILKPSVSRQITTLTTGEASAGVVVDLSALPKPAASPSLRTEPIGDLGAGRFVCDEGQRRVYAD